MNVKPKVTIDVDGILCDLYTPILLFAYQEYGKIVKLKSFSSPSDKLEEIIKEFLDDHNRLTTCLPYSDAKDSLSLLSKEYDLVIGTARFEDLIPITRNWLTKHELTPYISNFIIREYNERCNTFKLRASKDSVAIIDDSSNVITELSNRKRNIFTVRRPWNQSIKDSDHVSVYPSLMECSLDMIRKKSSIKHGF